MLRFHSQSSRYGPYVVFCMPWIQLVPQIWEQTAFIFLQIFFENNAVLSLSAESSPIVRNTSLSSLPATVLHFLTFSVARDE